MIAIHWPKSDLWQRQRLQKVPKYDQPDQRSGQKKVPIPTQRLGLGIAQLPVFQDLLKAQQMDPELQTSSVKVMSIPSWSFQFECCGVKDYTDWVERNDNFADPPRPNRPTVPDVCCERLSTAALVNQCKTKPSLYADRSFMNGCLTQIEEALEENEDIVMWVTIGALLIMVSKTALHPRCGRAHATWARSPLHRRPTASPPSSSSSRAAERSRTRPVPGRIV